MLENKHGDQYFVVNCGPYEYNFSKFNGKVITVDWEDHTPCPFIEFSTKIFQGLKLML